MAVGYNLHDFLNKVTWCIRLYHEHGHSRCRMDKKTCTMKGEYLGERSDDMSDNVRM